MAESAAGAPQLDAPTFDEKHAEGHPAEKVPAKKAEEDEEEDEDIDALIEDLESQDGHGEVSGPNSLFHANTLSCLGTHVLRARQSGRARQLRLILAGWPEAARLRPNRHLSNPTCSIGLLGDDSCAQKRV